MLASDAIVSSRLILLSDMTFYDSFSYVAFFSTSSSICDVNVLTSLTAGVSANNVVTYPVG